MEESLLASATGKTVTCTSIGVYEDALTRGRQYQVLAVDTGKRQIKVRGDQGRNRWYPAGCFDLSGGPVAVLVRWQFDEPIQDEAADWVDVSFDLSDGTRRWCHFVTPLYLKQLLEQPHAEPGFYSAQMIVVRSLTTEVVDRMLRKLDQNDELSEVSLPLEPCQPPLEGYPELRGFIKLYIWQPRVDDDEDREVARHFVASAAPELRQAILEQGRRVMAEEDFPWDDVSRLTDRMFDNPQEARCWLEAMLAVVATAP